MNQVSFTWTDADIAWWLFQGLAQAKCNVSLNNDLDKVVTITRVAHGDDGQWHVFVLDVDDDGCDVVGSDHDAGLLHEMAIHIW